MYYTFIVNLFEDINIGIILYGFTNKMCIYFETKEVYLPQRSALTKISNYYDDSMGYILLFVSLSLTCFYLPHLSFNVALFHIVFTFPILAQASWIQFMVFLVKFKQSPSTTITNLTEVVAQKLKLSLIHINEGSQMHASKKKLKKKKKETPIHEPIEPINGPWAPSRRQGMATYISLGAKPPRIHRQGRCPWIHYWGVLIYIRPWEAWPLDPPPLDLPKHYKMCIYFETKEVYLPQRSALTKTSNYFDDIMGYILLFRSLSLTCFYLPHLSFHIALFHIVFTFPILEYAS